MELREGDTIEVVSFSAAKGLRVTVPSLGMRRVVSRDCGEGSVAVTNDAGRIDVHVKGWAFGDPNKFKLVSGQAEGMI